jgi:hypothetical protein
MNFPTVGRIVHYHSYGSLGGEFKPEARAAVITEVDPRLSQEVHESRHSNPLIGLCVLNPSGLFFNRDVQWSPFPSPGCWNWPPRT